MARMLAAILLLGLCSLAACQTPADDVDAKVKELQQLQRRSSKGFIDLDAAAFEKFANGKGRPYSLYIIGDARGLRSTSKLNLPDRISAFGTVAKAFRATHAGQPAESKVFFARLTYEDARDAFSRLGVRGLPYLARIPPTLNVRPGAHISLPDQEQMMVPGDWSANDIGSFVAVTCGYSPGDLSAAGAASRSRLLPLFTLFFLAGALYVGVKLYYAPFMRWLPLYVLGGLFIFWFSVSGGMFNIIRGVPLVGYDPRTRNARLFMDGSGQLGAEGFIMGTHYLAFGVLVALFTRVLPTVKDNASRRAAGYTMLLLAFVLMVSVLNSHIWKTGMRSYFYF